jgi:O-antigen/teichoic acid export membrane protein
MSRPIIKTLPSLFFWQFVSVAAGLATQILLARSLGPYNKGILDLFLLVPVMISSTTEMGLLSANTYYAGKNTYAFHVLHSNSIAWSVAVGIIVFGVGSLVCALSGSPFGSLSPTVFILSLATVLPSIYFLLWSGLMYGSDEVRKVYIVTSLAAVASLGAYALALVLGAALPTVIWLGGGLLFVRAAMSVYSIRTRISPFQLSRAALKQSLLYGLALFVGLAVNTLHVRISQFLVEAISGPKELGFYALAVRIAELVWLLDYVVMTASLYRVTSADRQQAVLASQRTVKLVLIIVLPASLAVFALAPVLIPLLFGNAFSPSILPLWFLLPGIIAFSAARSLAPFVAYQYGKPWFNTASASVAFLINIAANLVLIPRFGISGAALASSISYAVNFILIGWIFVRVSGATLTETFWPSREDFTLVVRFLKERSFLQAS